MLILVLLYFYKNNTFDKTRSTKYLSSVTDKFTNQE